MTDKESIAKARQYLIKKGVCAIDGSGEPNTEALFARIAKLETGS